MGFSGPRSILEDVPAAYIQGVRKIRRLGVRSLASPLANERAGRGRQTLPASSSSSLTGRGIELHGYGSTTFKKDMADRGAEPDECSLIGEELRDYPHIVLDVMHSSPLLNKLDVYSAMDIKEVWVFQEGVFRIYVLDAGGALRRAEREPADADPRLRRGRTLRRPHRHPARAPGVRAGDRRLDERLCEQRVELRPEILSAGEAASLDE